MDISLFEELKKLDFSDRQAKFVCIYEGNGTKAARDAGYTGNDNVLGRTAFELLRNPKIVDALQKRNKVINPMVADRVDRQLFLTNVMNDSTAEIRDRIKATETLCKMDGDFIINHNINSDKPLAITMNYERKKKKPSAE